MFDTETARLAAENKRLLDEIDRLRGSPCEVCQRQDAPRISVHAECIIHSHETSTSDAVPRKQEEWATLHMQLTEAVEARSRREARLTAENKSLLDEIDRLKKSLGGASEALAVDADVIAENAALRARIEVLEKRLRHRV
jgi:predicted RNase H-like nuclease (RuvC/YqgF family)